MEHVFSIVGYMDQYTTYFYENIDIPRYLHIICIV